MSDYVWWVAGFKVPDNRWAFYVQKPELDIQSEVKKIADPIERGEQLPKELQPTEMRMVYEVNKDSTVGEKRRPLTDSNGRRFPHFFCQGYFCISPEIKEIFEQFELGDAQILPLRFFEADRTTPVEVTAYILIPANPKGAFLYSHPDGVQEGLETPELVTSRNAKISTEDDVVGVSKAALIGSDIWVEPKFNRTFFVCDRLANALRDNNLHTDFDFRRAVVV